MFVYFIGLKLHRIRDGDKFTHAMKVVYTNHCIQFSMWMVLIIYPPVSRRVLEFFQCSENIDGQYYIVRDYRIKCFDKKWFEMFPVALIALILYPLGIPVFILFKLWRYRKDLKNSLVLSRYGFLYAAYRENVFLWDAWELIRTLFLTGIVILIWPGRTSQVIVAAMANLTFLIILQYIQPYKNNNDRNLAVLSDIALTLTMLIGLLIKTDTMHSENWNSTVVDVSLVVINGAVSIYAAYTILLPTCLGFWIKWRKKNKMKKKSKKHHYNGVDLMISNVKVHPENSENNHNAKHVDHRRGRRKSLATSLVDDMVKEEKSYQIHMQRSKSDSHLRVQKRILKQKFMQAIRKEHGAASNEYTEAMKYVAEGAECDLRKLINSLPKEMRGQFEALL